MRNYLKRLANKCKYKFHDNRYFLYSAVCYRIERKNFSSNIPPSPSHSFGRQQHLNWILCILFSYFYFTCILKRFCATEVSNKNNFISAPYVSNLIDLDEELPTKSKILVCGGGITGASVVYHLSKLGLGNQTLLIEQGRLVL